MSMFDDVRDVRAYAVTEVNNLLDATGYTGVSPDRAVDALLEGAARVESYIQQGATNLATPRPVAVAAAAVAKRPGRKPKTATVLVPADTVADTVKPAGLNLGGRRRAGKTVK